MIRSSDDDFVVEELPAYEPSGEGEHLFLTIRKRGVTTLDAVTALARALGADARAAGHAGMKDRNAVATQRISLPFPLARSVDDVARLGVAGVEILDAKRHGNKLKPGHLVGNRFTLVLRGIAPERRAALAAAIVETATTGVPNAFGSQRFGRDGDNPERALAWLAGRERGPRDRREQRLLFSALQSHLFNLVLARRVADGTWATVLAGDVVKRADSGGLFVCEDAVADAERAARGEISATGPMFGAKMRRAEGEPGRVEREVLVEAVGSSEVFDAHRALGEGTRRSMRMVPADLSAVPDPTAEDALVVRFVLPKGAFATTVLDRVAEVDDASRRRGARPADLPDEPAPTRDDEKDPEA